MITYNDEEYSPAEVIRQARLDAKLTFAQMAERTGGHRTHICRHEQGDRDMLMGTFLQYVEALGLRVVLEANE